MSLIESKHAFAARCDELDSTGDLKSKLATEGIGTHRNMAFCLGTPQAPPTEQAVKDICIRLFRSDPPAMGQIALFRALHFESTTLVVQSFRDLVTQGDAESSSTKKVPVPEKRARLSAQRTRLGGLTIRGETEPSHQLLDLANAIYESGTMTYIPPKKCTKRDDEVSMGAKDKNQAVQIEGSVLKVGPEPLKYECDTGTELKLMWAFTRRAVAMDSCHLLSYEVQYEWIQKMMDCLAASAPPGYAKVSVSQVVRSDQELWLLLACEVPGPYKVDASGTSPLDAKFKALITDPRVSQFLLPLPKAVAHVADPLDGEKGKTGKGKGRGKSKGRGGKDRVPRNLPVQFKGLQTKTDKGNICFGFNLEEGCANQTRKVPHGIRCDRGLHICMRCHKPGHSLVSCRQAA